MIAQMIPSSLMRLESFSGHSFSQLVMLFEVTHLAL